MAFRVSGADIYVSFNAEAPDAIVGVAPIAVLRALVGETRGLDGCFLLRRASRSGAGRT